MDAIFTLARHARLKIMPIPLFKTKWYQILVSKPFKWCDQHVTSTEQRKNLSPQQELSLWPSVHRSDALTGWATKDSCELSHFQGSCDVFVYGPARHKPIVAQWLEYLSGERKVSGSIPLGDSDFFFCWSQRFSLFSSRNLKSTRFLYLSQQ